MSADKTAGDDTTKPRKQPRFLEWLPWEKTLIWGLFLLAIYTLRDFFFVIFVTFIVTYIMRGIIVRVTWLLTRKRHAPALERVSAVVCFALLIWGSYLAGGYLWPPLQKQFELLYGKASQFDAERELETFGARTVGTYLYNQAYPVEEGEDFEAAYQQFVTSSGEVNPTAYDAFSELQARVHGAFQDIEDGIKNEIREARIAESVAEAEKDSESFDKFLLSNAQVVYDADPQGLIKRWEPHARALREDFEEKKNSPDYEAWRDSLILQYIVQNNRLDPKRFEQDVAAWKAQLRVQAERNVKMTEVATSAEFRAKRNEQLAKLYADKQAASPKEFTYTFSRYQELEAAFIRARDSGERIVFYQALGEEPDMTEEEREEARRKGFRLQKQMSLWKEWWGSRGFAEKVRESVNSAGKAGVEAATAWATGAIKKSLHLVTMLSLALLLSFFISFDVPKLRKGVHKLRNSRVGGVYEEIAPGLINFGHLIGRAFQAQGVIAIFNTLLTFLAIKWLDIDNEVFLCTIVFVCSFIPVLGVVLSSAPIALIAIVQPNGSVLLAVQITVAIIVIHFIETSFLNPKILGDMLHLHPVFVLTVLAVGEHFFGVWGLLLGVPVTVYVVRFVILNEGIPGFIELPQKRTPEMAASGVPPAAPSKGEASNASAAPKAASKSSASKDGKSDADKPVSEKPSKKKNA